MNLNQKKVQQYTIVEELGSGAGGIVYSAFDTKLRRPVVLKMLHGSRRNQQNHSKTLREARFTSALDHPNIAAVFEVGEHDGVPFIAMQYVPGRTLSNRIAEGNMSVSETLSVGIQIAEGLAEAHRQRILHRDLKPSNIMIGENGLVKILDFGLAKDISAPVHDLQTETKTTSLSPSTTSILGTTAYMAPEQFVTLKSSEQSDVFALGVILYEMVASRHPFTQWGQKQEEISHAIQYREPSALHEIRDDLPEELEHTINRAIDKNPASRFGSAAEVRDALKTVMKSLNIEMHALPTESAVPMPAQRKRSTRKAGLFSAIARRFNSAKDIPKNTIVVLPFEDLDKTADIKFYGMALADAISTRIARLTSLVVRPTRTLSSLDRLPKDPIKTGRKLLVQYVLTGEFLRTGTGLEVHWQLLNVEDHKVQFGGSTSVPSRDLVALQNEISEEVFSALQVSGSLIVPKAFQVSLDAQTSDAYLEARGLLTNFVLHTSRKTFLDNVIDQFGTVLERQPEFAHAHSGLGVAHLHYVRYGFGGSEHLHAARRSLTRALEIDPELIEANVYRIYSFLASGEKHSARQSVKHLLETAGNHSDVRIVAGIVLRLDGLFAQSLDQFSVALELNPAIATMVYNYRARVYVYLGHLDQARQEVDKGLALDPSHSLLRTALGYLNLRAERMTKAAKILESVLEDDPDLRLAAPTLAMCYIKMGKPKPAQDLITQQTMHAAEADGEMAYRLATYFAIAGDTKKALEWFRKATYRGNENYPWFVRNPAWDAFKDNREFALVLAELRKTYRKNRHEWKRLFSEMRES